MGRGGRDPIGMEYQNVGMGISVGPSLSWDMALYLPIKCQTSPNWSDEGAFLWGTWKI